MSQKVAYVTGGMGGIGTAICQRLEKEGFKVIAGCGPTRDHAKWIAEQAALGFTFYASAGNVGDWDSTVEAFTKTKAEHGKIDLLVNNAGITRDRMFMKMTREEWDAVIGLGLGEGFHGGIPIANVARRGVERKTQGRLLGQPLGVVAGGAATSDDFKTLCVQTLADGGTDATHTTGHVRYFLTHFCLLIF